MPAFPCSVSLLGRCLGLRLSTYVPSDSVTPERPGPLRKKVSRDTQAREHLAHHSPRCACTARAGASGVVREAAGSSSLAQVLLPQERRQGPTAAPTRWGPGTWVMLAWGGSTHPPALAHGCTLAGHKLHQVPVLRGSSCHTRVVGGHSSVTSGGQGEIQHPAGVSLPGWVVESSTHCWDHWEWLGLLRWRQDEPLGYCLCLAASERTG